VDYRSLGNSGIKVSAVGLGVMTFGSQTSTEEAFKQLDLAFDAGVTLFDTAENYPAPIAAATQGRSEEILGKWIAARGVRDRVMIATKVSGPGNRPGDMTHIRGAARCLDRSNIAAAVNGSLRRLNTDCIDLYQVHWSERIVSTLRRSRYSYIPDAPEQTSIEETLAALAEQVTAGKIRHIGVCNESPWGVMQYLMWSAQNTLSEQKKLPRIVSIQNSYSLLDRLFEQGLAEISMREQVGLIGYSPLASGLLTGKYTEAKSIEGSRSSLFPGFEARFSKNMLGAAAAYAKLAREHGFEPGIMALAFARQRPFMTSVLMAASSAAQLEHNLRSVDVTLSKEILKSIDAIHDQFPNPH
jgi:aryl-alcohol dehydrogenase-like predicted oxidoreductase